MCNWALRFPTEFRPSVFLHQHRSTSLRDSTTKEKKTKFL
jgi:hypothetical protein